MTDALTHPKEKWTQFLLDELIPLCTQRGWKVEYDQVSDGRCTVFADKDKPDHSSDDDGVEQLRLIPNEPDSNPYYQV